MSTQGAEGSAGRAATGAALLLAATIVALAVANSPAAAAFSGFWARTPFVLDLGWLGGIDLDLRHWVNDALMALFFLGIGLELRREWSHGALRDRRVAAVPAIAAIGGMAVPALLYLAVNGGGDGARGWGIVMATDIAFVLGALAILGSRVAPGVRVFLLTLAIVDDVGAIVVIAAVYAGSIGGAALAAAGVVAILLIALPRVLRRDPPGVVLVLAGLVLWYLTLQSGVHPTIAAVVLGLLVPVTPGPGGGPSTNERWGRRLAVPVALVVVPIFALANAGVPLGGDVLSRALASPVSIGVVIGLVLGKLVGVSVAALLVSRRSAAALPAGMGRQDVLGAAALAGIGFTVSLFVVDLAFADPALRAEAKIGVLAASAIATTLGLGVLGLRRRRVPGAAGHPA